MNGVLFVSLAGGLGGSTRSLATVLRHLEGSVTRILAAPATGSFHELVAAGGLAERRILLPATRSQGRASRVVAALRLALWALRNRGSVTAVHANGPSEINVVACAALILRVPIVVWCHHYAPSAWMRRLAPIVRRLPLSLRWAAVSTVARDVLVQAGLTNGSAIEVIPNPIDPSEVVGTRTASSTTRVAYVGSDRAYKGFQLLPDIIEAIDDRRIHWLIFSEAKDGDPAAWERLRAMDHSRVEVKGKLPDLRRVYGVCDVVVCPSLQESFCRVAAEAMLNGLPVVASDLPPLRDLLGTGAGLLFPPGDARAAGQAVRTLAGDPSLRERLGSRGREVVERFAPDPIVHRLAALYGVPFEGVSVPFPPSPSVTEMSS